MKKNLLLFLFSFLIQLYAQEDGTVVTDSTLSRYRLLVGTATSITEGNFHNRSPLILSLNANRRSSNFILPVEPFKVKWYFEYGFNFGNISDVSENFPFLLPYLKTGPELSLINNFFVCGSVGLAASLFVYPAILPYIGINGGYFYQLSDGTFLEFEVGYHPVILFDNTKS